MADIVTPPVGTPPAATPPAAPPVEGGAPPAVPPAAVAPEWFSGFSEENRGVVQLKGFKSAESVLDSYRNIEKLLGHPKERLLALPENLDDPKNLDPIYDRLGRPKAPTEYDVKVPEGMNPEFGDWARKQFHGLGLSKRQGDAMAKAWNDRVTTQIEAEQSAFETGVQQQTAKLKEEWGAAFDQNSKTAKLFAEKIGFSDEHCQELAKAIGVDGVNKLFVGIVNGFGLNLGEAQFHGGDSGGNNFRGPVLTPEAAKARITELKNDKEWIGRFSNGGSKEREELHRLNMWANPSLS